MEKPCYWDDAVYCEACAVAAYRASLTRAERWALNRPRPSENLVKDVAVTAEDWDGLRAGLPEAETSPPETDCPQNCSACHKPLNVSLTSAGVEYVIDKLRTALVEGLDARSYRVPGRDWYRKSPHYDIARDWAKDLKDYGLEGEDKLIVDLYLDACNFQDEKRSKHAGNQKARKR